MRPVRVKQAPLCFQKCCQIIRANVQRLKLADVQVSETSRAGYLLLYLSQKGVCYDGLNV